MEKLAKIKSNTQGAIIFAALLFVCALLIVTSLFWLSRMVSSQEKDVRSYYQVKILAPEEPTEENINKWLKDHPGWEPIYINWGSYVVPHFWVKKEFVNHRQKKGLKSVSVE